MRLSCSFCISAAIAAPGRPRDSQNCLLALRSGSYELGEVASEVRLSVSPVPRPRRRIPMIPFDAGRPRPAGETDSPSGPPASRI